MGYYKHDQALVESDKIGDGTSLNRTAPVQVLTNVNSIAAGHDFNIARKVDGTFLMWGANHSGTLGPGAAGPFNPVPSENVYLRNASAFEWRRSPSRPGC